MVISVDDPRPDPFISGICLVSKDNYKFLNPSTCVLALESNKIFFTQEEALMILNSRSGAFSSAMEVIEICIAWVSENKDPITVKEFAFAKHRSQLVALRCEHKAIRQQALIIRHECQLEQAIAK